MQTTLLLSWLYPVRSIARYSCRVVAPKQAVVMVNSLDAVQLC